MKKYLATSILNYLKWLARLQLRKGCYGTIIGVTGSAGKSSARNAIYTVLRQKYRVKASFGANSESGIPLNILGLAMRDYSVSDWLRVLLLAPWQLLCNWQRFDFYIVEMGIDSPDAPKNMSYLLSIIRPDIGVLLNVGLNHAFAFDHLLGAKNLGKTERQERLRALIGAEKAQLITSLPATGLALINGDDQLLHQLTLTCKAPRQFFGQKQHNQLQLHQQSTEYRSGQLQSHFRMTDQTGVTIELQFSRYLLLVDHAYSLAPAIILGQKFGLSMNEIKVALEQQLALPPSRASILAGKNHSTIIDSSYNASGMLNMLRDFLQLPQPKNQQKRVLLGDMRELGASTRDLHQQVAALLNRNPVAKVYLVGTSMAEFVLPILRQQQVSVEHFQSASAAGQALANEVQTGDLILVKGSQNTIFLEEAIKVVLANPADAKHLCRQNPWWLQAKTKP